MHVSKEFLVEAVGLSLLVALLVLGVRMFQRAETVIEFFDRRSENRIAMLEEYEITRFEGCELDGISAISYIKNMVVQYHIPVYVETPERTFLVDDKEQLKELRREGSEYYMNSLQLFQCEIIRNENESIEQIVISATEGEEG